MAWPQCWPSLAAGRLADLAVVLALESALASMASCSRTALPSWALPAGSGSEALALAGACSVGRRLEQPDCFSSVA